LHVEKLFAIFLAGGKKNLPTSTHGIEKEEANVT
jgi:hypothetical protein